MPSPVSERVCGCSGPPLVACRARWGRGGPGVAGAEDAPPPHVGIWVWQALLNLCTMAENFFLNGHSCGTRAFPGRNRISASAVTYTTARQCQVLQPTVSGQGLNPHLHSDPSRCIQVLNPPCHSGNSNRKHFWIDLPKASPDLLPVCGLDEFFDLQASVN